MDNKDNRRPLLAHLSIFSACVLWGLMAPVGKDAMSNGVNGIAMVAFRVAGGAALFWLASLFAPKEHVPARDRLKFCGAAVFGLILNQGCFTIGLGITSPVNASIMTTSLPIFAMVLAAIILKEPITGKKAAGVLTGCCGAVMLILSSATADSGKVGDMRGDMLCMGAQLSFALYLSLFSGMIKKYSAITVSKWMFLWGAAIILPLTSGTIAATDWHGLPASSWAGVAYVVVGGTFGAYMLMMVAQRTLRPTVVSIYNYMQPAVAVTVSLVTGMSVLTWTQGAAICLVFGGVWLVVKSKSRNDIINSGKKERETSGGNRKF